MLKSNNKNRNPLINCCLQSCVSFLWNCGKHALVYVVMRVLQRVPDARGDRPASPRASMTRCGHLYRQGLALQAYLPQTIMIYNTNLTLYPSLTNSHKKKEITIILAPLKKWWSEFSLSVSGACVRDGMKWGACAPVTWGMCWEALV